MVIVHECAPEGTRIYGTIAVGWILLAAGLTMTVHLGELMAVQRNSFQGFHAIFSWQWPSVFHAIDIVALFRWSGTPADADAALGALKRWGIADSHK
jgi:hypothetical protein